MKKQNIPLFKQTRSAGDSEKRIRETRPKASKEKSSVTEAHPDEVFVMEGPDDWAMAHNTEQAQEKAVDAINRQNSPFAYQGVVASKIQEDIRKTAARLSGMGYGAVAEQLLALANEPADVLSPEVEVVPPKAKKPKAPAAVGAASSGAAGAAAEVAGDVAGAAAGVATAIPSPIDDDIINKGKALAAKADDVLPDNLSAGTATTNAIPAAKKLLTVKNLGRGLGLIGAAASVYDIYSDGPNVSNVASLGISVIPLLATGPVGAIAAGAGLAGTLLYNAYTGSFKESLPTDVDDALAEIKDLKTGMSPSSVDLLEKMETALNNIKTALASLRPGMKYETGVSALGILAASQVALSRTLPEFEQSAKANDYSFFRHTLRVGFPKLQHVIQDVSEGVADVGPVFEKAAQVVWKDVMAAARKDVAGSSAGSSPTPGATSAASSESESARIRGIQRYFAEQGEEVEETGEWDGPTHDAMQKVLNSLADLGVTENVSMSSLKNQNYESMYELRNLILNWRSRTDKAAIT